MYNDGKEITEPAMKEKIEKAGESDLPEILEVYKEARAFMAANGNPSQWGLSGYPKEELLREDIALSRLYVLRRGGRIAAAFVIAEGEEPTYSVIEDGAWPNGKAYLTIHRLGSRTRERGAAKAAIDFCGELAKSRGEDVRADTHADNAPMRHILEKYGFRYCGIIYVRDGSKRLAYQLEL